ncbi:peptidoglycan-binding protein [Actinoplanes sp. NEAU-A11]|jgi:peptidoglycan hydrolase-like protein with peptidoglycan-binding domain|uniref:Peptidoglycan-binding protein n=1 Tax=Actinoplanes aureus TaxID=2792083 RepID=A0A931C6I1_9ACTN|nr:peptidoglycan-binding protein [Actinoplanes aureus]
MAATLNPWPTIRQGAKNDTVTTLQYLLLAHGHTVTVDGIFGAQTGAAVRAYQLTKNLVEDGVVGPETWRALIVEVRPGARGNAVRGVQREFQLRGDVAPQSDGVYGPATEEAVRAFQAALRAGGAELDADGVVGPRTWQALVGGVRAPVSQAA